jgi:heptosyltransferase III
MTVTQVGNDPEVILIFQIGSMGDTVVSLPCYREIARRHPGATRYLLTNRPSAAKMVPAESILSATGLIADSIAYSWPLRGRDAILGLYRKLAALRATALYYLAPETKQSRLIRHYMFFRLCGIRRIYGLPWSRDLKYPRETPERGIWESEGSRLLRCVGAQTNPGAPSFDDRDLYLSEQERSTAASAVVKHLASRPFITIAAGGKIPLKEWGNHNWLQLVRTLSKEYPHLGVLFVGSADERERNDELAKAWEGPSFNSCGLFSPRETAALIEQAALFIGHDTGTLHLAAAVDTRVIGIYCARDVPGKWFSDRSEDTFFYTRLDCFNCQHVEVADCPNDRRCITSTTPEMVFLAARKALVHLGVGTNPCKR